VFEVRDTGIGIPEEKIPTLTDPFTRHDTNPYKTQDGVGLGLAICKSLVELHGGELSIESELGKGTVVSMMLPSRAS
jgi:two-component system cell cycle sensor histidine kinase PleC